MNLVCQCRHNEEKEQHEEQKLRDAVWKMVEEALVYRWFGLSGGIACRMVGVLPLPVVVLSSISGERAYACHRQRG